MYITRFFSICAILALTACGTTKSSRDWYGSYDETAVGSPAQMQYGANGQMYGDINDGTEHKIAVLLPLSGTNAAVGQTIRTSVTLAALQHAPQNLQLSFFDTGTDSITAINQALSSNPDVIIGPVFANDARILRESKPLDLPVLSFTSDATAIGNGVMTMALMPTNSIEISVKEMAIDGAHNFIVLAPDSDSGRLMAGTAKQAAQVYNIPLVGIFYYTDGDTDSIKNTTIAASMNTARTAANNRAREILSDILTRESLTALEKSSLAIQLDNLGKVDTLGKLPYDAVLFLGTGADTESLASFLRYYGVGNRDVRFYGTAMWDGSNLSSDLTMSGSKYPALAEMPPEFVGLYEQMSGTAPTRLATFGYDATNMAIGMIYSPKSNAAYLLDPSGYVGMDGLVRMTPSGASQRGLRIMELVGDGNIRTVRNAPVNFMTPIYNIDQSYITPAEPMSLQTSGVNPTNYIKIPERFRSKYRAKTYGANMTVAAPQTMENVITILPEDDSDAVISPEFEPSKLEPVTRKYIDSIEIEG